MGKKSKKQKIKQARRGMEQAKLERLSELLGGRTIGDVELLLSRYGHGIGIGPLSGPEDDMESKPRHKMGFQPNDE